MSGSRVIKSSSQPLTLREQGVYIVRMLLYRHLVVWGPQSYLFLTVYHHLNDDRLVQLRLQSFLSSTKL